MHCARPVHSSSSTDHRACQNGCARAPGFIARGRDRSNAADASAARAAHARSTATITAGSNTAATVATGFAARTRPMREAALRAEV